MNTTIKFNNSITGDICDVKVSVKEEKYDNGNVFYYISYKTVNFNSAHPFYSEKYFREHDEGDIVFKNSLTETLINYLFMDESELSKITGATTPLSYKGQVMKSLALLFD
jgi:hypothetical protein